MIRTLKFTLGWSRPAVLGPLVCALLMLVVSATRGQACSVSGDDVTAARPPEAAEFNADARVDVDAMDKYEAAVRGMLNDNKFEVLDKTASTLRAEKIRFAGGPWKLFIFYRGLKQPTGGYKADDKAWASHLARLAVWAEQYPESVTAHVALAEALFEYTEKGRFDQEAAGRAGQQTEESVGWEQIASRAHAAKIALQAASQLQAKCPHLYFVKQEIVRKPNAALLKEAQAFEPAYYYYYRMQALLLRLDSDVAPDAADKFADEVSSRIGGDEGLIAYYEIAATLNAAPDYNLWPMAKLSWPRVLQGYTAMEKRYGTSIFKANQMALLAVRAQDIGTAKRMFAVVGDKWASEIWGTRDLFASWRAWAAAPPEVASMLSSASANQSTAEGQQYNKVVWDALRRNYGMAYKSCKEPLGQERTESFDLLIEVSGDGSIQVARSWPQTELGDCFAPQLLNGKIAAPPKPSFWVSVPFHFQQEPH